MIRKHLYGVWQNLWQFQIANITTILRSIYLAFILILLELPKGCKGRRQAVPLLVHIVELMCEQEEIAEKLHCKVWVAIGNLAIGSK